MSEGQLVLQFSTVAPDYKFRIPTFAAFLKSYPFRFLTDKNWASPWIRRASHSPFSHLDLCLADGSLVGASNSPEAPVIRGNASGVAQRPGDYQEFAYRRRMVLKTDRAQDVIAIWCSQIGKPFDHSNMLDFFSDRFPGYRDWRLDDCWRCSELGVWALEVGGMWGTRQLPWPKNRVSPTDVLLLLLTDDRWVNRDSFWDPVPGLKLGPHER